MDDSDGVPERAGRNLARGVARGRVIARRLGDPGVRERILATGRIAVARHGPDVAEQAAQQAVDRTLWGIAGRAGLLGVALHRLRPAAGRVAGQLARRVASRVGGRQEV
jgi:hypothetical protein